MSAKNITSDFKECLMRCSNLIEKYPDLVANLIKKWEKDILSQAAYCFESIGYFPDDFEVIVNTEENEEKWILLSGIFKDLCYVTNRPDALELMEDEIISIIKDEANLSVTVKVYDRWFTYLGVTCIEYDIYSINNMIDYHSVGDEVLSELLREVTCLSGQKIAGEVHSIEPYIEIWRKEYPGIKEKAQRACIYGASNYNDTAIEFLLYRKAVQSS